MNILCNRIRGISEYAHIRQSISEMRRRENKHPALVTGLCEGAVDAFLAALTSDEKCDGPSLVITYDEKNASHLLDALSSHGLRCAIFPVREPVLYNMVASHETEHERLAALMGIVNGELDAVIAVCDAAISYTIPRDILEKSMMRVEVGREYVLGELCEFLVASGYVSSDLVDGRGQFSVRGGILDVFPPQLQWPVRMEFFGDEIDQMGYFDVFTQRKIEQIQCVDITAAREILLDDANRSKIASVIKNMIKKAPNDEARESLSRELSVIENEADVPFADKYISVVYSDHISLIDYFGDDNLVFVIESTSVFERLAATEWHMNETVTELIQNGVLSGKCSSFALPSSVLESFFGNNYTVLVNSFVSKYDGKLMGAFSFKTRTPPAFVGNFEAFVEDLQLYNRADISVLLLCPNDAEATSLSEMIENVGMRARIVPKYTDVTDVEQGVFTITSAKLSGFEISEGKFACISLGESREKVRTVHRRKAIGKKSAKEKILSYADLSVGDYVVHVTHGIGRYMGLESVLSYDGVRSDHIKIQYAGTGVLYVPCEKIDSVSKYIGAVDDESVRLSKLGGGEWERTKARVRSEVKSMAKELIALYAERMRKPGFAFAPDDEMQREFEESFEHDETDGQLIAIEEIKKDMERPVPMDRLLCGDVGFGKTEVALRAAFKAVMSGKQVAILVPTTILAMQHYQTISSRMRAFPLKVSMLSRFKTQKELDATVRAVARGDVDIIVGTHRLLSNDVSFRDLGLVIIDEEQRFGVAHKEKLKQLSKNVDVLTLTATPIPRTLNMAMSDIRDMSVLDEAPMDRLPVQTYVLEHDDIVINEAIRRELRRGGQVFYLYNRVDTMASKAAKLKSVFPEAEIAIAHGQMEKEELSEIWQELVAGKIDILVCTTIIETGVDVPNANTLVIENSDKMGLAQLHQIRGRIGRSSRRAFAYFTFPQGQALSEISSKRLQAIRDFTEFGSGFKIAMRDLEIRGAGDVLGARQSGHMESVGYDLYVKILNEAILEERGETIPEKVECVVNIGRDSYIPESYVPSAAQRIDIYKKIARITKEEDVDDIADELLDRYGDLPPSVETLMSASLARAAGAECGFVQIERKGNDIVIYPKAMDIVTWSKISEAFPGRILITPSQRPFVTCKNRRQAPIFTFVLEILKKYIQLISQKQ